MTFEELQILAAEQNSRIFNLECSLQYSAKEDFRAHHFRLLRQNYIYNCCWESMFKLNFPFENIVPNIQFVHTVSDTSSGIVRFAGVSFQFSLFILNRPEMTLSGLSNLMAGFLTAFDDLLIRLFKVPIEVKSTTIFLQLQRTHSLFTAVNKSESF